jgi:hypothetical protein
LEELVELSLEDDLKDVKDTVENHGERIGKLEIDNEVMKERWSNITVQLTRIENQSLSSNNALLASNNVVLQTLQKVVDSNTTTNTNNTEVVKTKNTNRKEILINVLKVGGSIIGVLILGYFAMKGVSVSIPIF